VLGLNSPAANALAANVLAGKGLGVAERRFLSGGRQLAGRYGQ
jgi:hypothetical protein